MPSSPAIASVAKRRAAVTAATAALTGLSSLLWQAVGDELGPLFRDLDDLSRMVEAARVAVLAEAVQRGETTGARAGSGGSDGSDGSVRAAGVGWVTEWAPSLAVGAGAGRLFRVVTETTTEAAAAATTAATAGAAAGVGVLREALLAGSVSVGNGVGVWRRWARLAPRLVPGVVVSVWEAMVTVAAVAGPREIRGLGVRIVDGYGRPDGAGLEQDRGSAAGGVVAAVRRRGRGVRVPAAAGRRG